MCWRPRASRYRSRPPFFVNRNRLEFTFDPVLLSRQDTRGHACPFILFCKTDTLRLE
jgi:hypothetical protein